MLEIRPIVVDDDMTVLGGNMRLRACMDAGMKEVPIIRASDLTDDQKRRFIIADNVGYGEWDWESLANECVAEDATANAKRVVASFVFILNRSYLWGINYTSYRYRNRVFSICIAY